MTPDSSLPPLNSMAIEAVPWVPDDLPVLFADGLSILVTGGVVVLSFLQAQFPIFQNDTDLSKIGPIRNKCVVRIVVSEEKMREFSRVIGDVAPSFASKE